MKRFAIFTIILIASIFFLPQHSLGQSQDPIKFNDWVILTVGPATVEHAIENFLATDEWAISRGFEFTGVIVNFAPFSHFNAFGAMCVDKNGFVYGFIFDSSGELMDYYAMGYIWR